MQSGFAVTTRPAPTELTVTYTAPDGERVTRRFAERCLVGRDVACDIRLDQRGVSRRHLECALRNGYWWVRDLQSRNGTYCLGRRLHRPVPLADRLVLNLTPVGPELVLALERAREPVTAAPADAAVEPAPPPAAIIAEPTPLPSRPTVHRHYRPALLVALLLLVTVFGFALYQYQSVHRLRAIAVDMFYSMKALELQVLDLQQLVQAQLSANEEDEALASTLTDYREALAAQRQRLVELRQRYAEFMTRVNAARLALDSEERLILRVARAFGECDANAPEEFIAEVKRYIDLWQTTRRLPRAIQRLQANGYAPAIIRALKARNLPPQFLYLALQESEFRTEAVGPATDYGHAKGMWQFIPETGLRYGLNPGPRMGEKAYDPADERHDFVKSTRAAARYLSDLYRTEAQASGLLVMASYNWGEGNILSLLDSLPANPLQRNFWTLLQHHAIPRETYDYVFYIVAAAAIGENPALFGFEFENPLTGYDAPVLTSEWEGSRAARAGLEH